VPGLSRLQILDVAVESQGVFWLATSEGLARHAPKSWRVPQPVGEDPVMPLMIEEDSRGGLWLPAQEGLYSLREGLWQGRLLCRRDLSCVQMR
jgi:ligand-binding sensor domain-containing protein